MIDMAQLEKGFYRKPYKDDYLYHLVNSVTGETIATYTARPRAATLTAIVPDFFDNTTHKLIKETA